MLYYENKVINVHMENIIHIFSSNGTIHGFKIHVIGKEGYSNCMQSLTLLATLLTSLGTVSQHQVNDYICC